MLPERGVFARVTRCGTDAPTRIRLEFLDETRVRLSRALRQDAIVTADEAAVREALIDLDETMLEHVLTGRQLESYRMGYRERVTDMHLEHVRDLPRTLPPLFAAAARRARATWFRLILLAHTCSASIVRAMASSESRPVMDTPSPRRMMRENASITLKPRREGRATSSRQLFVPRSSAA